MRPGRSVSLVAGVLVTGLWAVIVLAALDSRSLPVRDLGYSMVAGEGVPLSVEEAVDRLLSLGGREVVNIGDETYAMIAPGQRIPEGSVVEVQAVRGIGATIEVYYRESRPEGERAVPPHSEHPYALVKFKNPRHLPILFRKAQRWRRSR